MCLNRSHLGKHTGDTRRNPPKRSCPSAKISMRDRSRSTRSRPLAVYTILTPDGCFAASHHASLLARYCKGPCHCQLAGISESQISDRSTSGHSQRTMMDEEKLTLEEQRVRMFHEDIRTATLGSWLVLRQKGMNLRRIFGSGTGAEENGMRGRLLALAVPGSFQSLCQVSSM
jgi:hypothetical protein